MPTKTRKSGFHLLRFKAAVDATLLATGTSGFNMLTKPDGAVDISSLDINRLEIIAAIQGADGETAVVNLYAGRSNKGPARLLATLTWTGGTQEITYDPESGVAQGTADGTTNTMDRYCDTVAITENAGLVGVNLGIDQGNDRIASVWFDPWGNNWLYAEVETLTDPEAIKLWWSYV